MSTKKLQILGSFGSTDADTLDGKHADEFVSAADLESTVSEQVETLINEIDNLVYVSEENQESAVVPLNADTLQGYDASAFAPSGFGLGEDATVVSVSALSELTQTGWYRFGMSPSDKPLANYGGLIRVEASNLTIVQTVYVSAGDEYYGVVATRQKISGETDFRDWEWVNPPMIAGVEYRTTERFLGKPVYIKAVSCGTLGANTADDVTHSISNIDAIWVHGGYWTNGTNKLSLPYFGGADDNHILVSANRTAIHRAHKGSTYNIVSTVVVIKYTKTTD